MAEENNIRFGVVVFPGSNCDHDAYHAVKHVLGRKVTFLWHKENDLAGVNVVILPGGFSYGDYLRCGSIARFSPIMKEVIRFSEAGGFLIGICNGFQILTETGQLPGALLRNSDLRFVCRNVTLRVENNGTAFTGDMSSGDLLTMPVAHGEGNYHCDSETLAELEERNRVVFRYATPEGDITAGCNPNGSANNIAGIINDRGNVLGMMPHPERSVEKLLGSSDGLAIFKSLVTTLTKGAGVEI